MPAPDHVVLLGLGPSLEHYVDTVKRIGNRKKFADEVWAINAVGDVIQCDRIFHMDDVRVQEMRAARSTQRRAAAAEWPFADGDRRAEIVKIVGAEKVAEEKRERHMAAFSKGTDNIGNMLEWLRAHPGPIYTSQVVQGYPGLVEFPLEDVINDLGYCYFNGTAAYVVAYAVHLGVKKISIFGCDYTLANSHHAEQGRACVEFWLGIAAARGIEICISGHSSLMDQCEPGKPYGYDLVDVKLEPKEDRTAVVITPAEQGPTAEDIERRYDHSRHTNPLLR